MGPDRSTGIQQTGKNFNLTVIDSRHIPRALYLLKKMLFADNFLLKLLDVIPVRLRIRIGKNIFRKHFNLAKKSISRKEKRKAISYLLVANKFRPGNRRCLALLCNCYSEINDIDKAFFWGQEYIIRHPDENTGFQLCADLLRQKISLAVRSEIFGLLKNLTVAELIKRENLKTYPCWWVFCTEYYKYFLKKHYATILSHRAENPRNRKNRVFIFTNKVKESNTSSHLAILADIMNLYERNGIECHLLLAPHPFSGVGNFGRIGIRDTNLTDTELEARVKEYIDNLIGPAENEYRVNCLFDLSVKNLSIKDYCSMTAGKVAEFSINEYDIVLLVGGWCGSSLLTLLSAYCPARKYFLMFSGDNPFNDIVDIADYILHPAASYVPFFENAINAGFAENQVLQNIILTRPFHWEEQEFGRFNLDEENFLEEIYSLNPDLLVLSAALKLELRFNQEFCKIIIEIINKNPNNCFSFIGTSSDRMFSLFPELGEYKNNFKFLEFSEHLFSVYKKISKINSVYIFPRDCGSGRSNVYAAYAGIPTILFRGNDAESQLPRYCFVESREEMIGNLNKLSADREYRDTFIKEVVNDRCERVNKIEGFYVGLTDMDKYPKVVKTINTL